MGCGPKTLEHGNSDLVARVAQLLKENTRPEVLPYVYREELLSDNSNVQEEACDYLELVAPGASAKVLQRLCDDPMETANSGLLRSCLINLNDYRPSILKLSSLLWRDFRKMMSVFLMHRLLLYFFWVLRRYGYKSLYTIQSYVSQ